MGDIMPLKDCENCGTTNNLIVNPHHCYSCGHEWEGVWDRDGQ